MHSAIRTRTERVPLSDAHLERIDVYWRAANYLEQRYAGRKGWIRIAEARAIVDDAMGSSA